MVYFLNYFFLQTTVSEVFVEALVGSGRVLRQDCAGNNAASGAGNNAAVGAQESHYNSSRGHEGLPSSRGHIGLPSSRGHVGLPSSLHPLPHTIVDQFISNDLPLTEDPSIQDQQDQLQHLKRCAQDEHDQSDGRLKRCHLCPYSTKKTSNLKDHLRTHSGEKPYPCPHCSSWFSRSTSLRRHLNLHLNLINTSHPSITGL